MNSRYEIEIGGSRTVRRTASTFANLIQVLNRAQGLVSVLCEGREVAFGSADQVREQARQAQEWGEWQSVATGDVTPL